MAVGQATPPPSVVFFSPIGCVAAAKSLPCNTRHLLPHSPFLRKVFVGVLHLISDTSRNPSSNIGSISCSKVITSPSFDGRSFDGRSEVALPKSNLPTFHPPNPPIHQPSNPPILQSTNLPILQSIRPLRPRYPVLAFAAAALARAIRFRSSAIQSFASAIRSAALRIPPSSCGA